MSKRNSEIDRHERNELERAAVIDRDYGFDSENPYESVAGQTYLKSLEMGYPVRDAIHHADIARQLMWESGRIFQVPPLKKPTAPSTPNPEEHQHPSAQQPERRRKSRMFGWLRR